MLILFDIDATLISTSGAGMKAMHDAARELFSPDFSIAGIEFAGRLDPLIITDMLAANRVRETPETVASFRAAYRTKLIDRLKHPDTIARSLPGVAPLVEALKQMEPVCLGLLTGNFAETGSIKLRACGIDPDWFPIQVWGDESPYSPPRRDHLPAVALDRFRARHSRDIHPSRAVIIGDTPHDIACAKAHGLRSLAVATGSFTVDKLASHSPDRVVPNLSDTTDIAHWLTHP